MSWTDGEPRWLSDEEQQAWRTTLYTYMLLRRQMDRDLRHACEEMASAIGLEVEVKEFWYFPPASFHPDLVATVRNAAAAQGYPHQDIISGAGHDAVYMARVVPSAMIFVPCVGGISHNEIEDAKPEDLTAGCNVLLNAVLECADAVK